MISIYEKIQTLLDNNKPLNVKFIRLGSGGSKFKECHESNSIYFGFGTENFLSECNEYELNEILIQKIIEKNYSKVNDTMRQLKSFFMDKGDTLWITTCDRTLYFGFTSGEKAFTRFVDNKPETYKKMEHSWTNKDRNGNVLNISGLNGGITKTLAYQSTICDFQEKYSKLLVNRILNIPSKEKESANLAYDNLKITVEELIKQFEPKDFELLIELIISRAGLKRIGVAGKQEELIDLEIKHPMTNEVYIVQVKSRVKKSEFEKYVKGFRNYQKNNQDCKMIYAFHTGEISTDEDDVIIWDSKRISELAVNNGLVDWIIDVAPV